MIEVKNVVKTFDGFAALNDATISVPTGAVYGLVGPNGAGKSTIIRHLTGIFRQDSGTVRLGGEDVWENAALKAKIAAIPDDWYYFNSAGIGDMMRFYKGFYPNFSTERYEKLREVFELDEKRPIRRFSKGMQKQAAFWLALSAMPDYLILDEPVDGLDQSNTNLESINADKRSFAPDDGSTYELIASHIRCPSTLARPIRKYSFPSCVHPRFESTLQK